MKIKRILATLLVACMIFGILPASVLAAGNGRVYIDTDTSVKAGETVTVNLNIENNPGIAALTVRVFYKTLTCEKISTNKDKDNNETAVKKFVTEFEEDGVTSIISANKNDTATIPAARRDAGWSMASFAYAFNDEEEKGRSFSTDGVIASMQFAAASDLETEDVAIEIEILKANGSSGDVITLDGSKDTIHVNGNPPTLDSIKVELKDGNGVYGTASTFKLTALSTKNKDISNLVEFYNNAAEANISITGSILTTSGTTGAGTYTVYAKAADGACTVPEGKAGEFTIAKLELASPTITINGFTKGSSVSNADLDSSSDALDQGLTWYEGTGADKRLIDAEGGEKFKAGTTYTVEIKIKPDDNHSFAADADLTVKGLGDDQKVTIKDNGDGTYSATATGTTGAKETLRPDSNAGYPDCSTVYYGQKLGDSKIDSTGAYALDTNGNHIPGHYEWVAPEQSVGDAADSKGFKAWFIPDDSDLYEKFETTLCLRVQRVLIDVSSVAWSNTALTYNGENQSVTLNLPEDIAALVTVAYEGNTAKVVGDYTATATLTVNNTTNYMFKGATTTAEESTYTTSTSWEIKKGTIDSFAKTLSLLYGPAQRISITPEFLGLPEGESFTAKFREADGLVSWNSAGELYVKRDTTDADVGKIGYVKLQYESDNYNTFYVTINVEIITKKDAGLEVTGIPATLVYGESAVWSYNVTNHGEDGDMECTVSPNDILDNGLHKLSAIGVGTATVTITYSSDTTYAKQEFTITVTPKPISAAVSHDPISYGDPVPTSGYSVNFTGLVGKDSLDGLYTVSTTYIKDNPAGEYDLTCVLDDSVKNYTLAPADVTGKLTVSKKSLTSDMISFTDTPDYTYDGNEKQPAVTVAGLSYDTDYTVSYRNNVNAGVDTAVVTVTVNSNNPRYTGFAEKTFTIKPKSLTNATLTLDDAALTYNTREQKKSVTVKDGETTLELDKDYTVSYTDCVSAGTVTVTVTGKGNYTGKLTDTYTIRPASLKLSPYTITNFYTETEEKTVDLPSDFFISGETNTSFSVQATAATGDSILANVPATVGNRLSYRLNGTIGTVSVTITVTPDSQNYESGTYIVTINSIDKTNVSGSIVFESGSAVYTGTGLAYENASIAGLSGTMTYTYTPDTTTGALLDATTGLPLTVGTYTVTARFDNAENYGSKDATFTITKATPVGTPSYTKLEADGKTLADAALTVGTITPAGTIAWDLPGTTVALANTEYAWTFTPTDTHNYNVLTGKLTPYVRDDLSWLPGVINGGSNFTFHDVNRFDYYYDSVKWAADNGIASGTSRFAFSPDAVCTRAQTVTFLWRAAGSPLPRYRACPFTDVQANDYYYEAVLWAVEQGITTGLTATTFGPDETVTRGQVATFLYRAASAAKPNTFNPFTDVKTTAYNFDAILWAYDNRITTGTSTTTFSPDAFCTRAQIVTFLYRYYQGR